MASLITGALIVHFNLVEVDGWAIVFFCDLTASLGGAFGVYHLSLLPILSTTTDKNYIPVTLPEPTDLILPVIGFMGIGIFRCVFNIQELSASGILVIETGFGVSAGFTKWER